MSASSKFESPPPHMCVAKVVVIDGRQAILLPENVHVDAAELDILQQGNYLMMRPAGEELSPDEFDQWLADMRRFQEELGDFMPEGRNQPPMPEPTDEFKRFFGIEDVEG